MQNHATQQAAKRLQLLTPAGRVQSVRQRIREDVHHGQLTVPDVLHSTRPEVRSWTVGAILALSPNQTRGGIDTLLCQNNISPRRQLRELSGHQVDLLTERLTMPRAVARGEFQRPPRLGRRRDLLCKECGEHLRHASETGLCGFCEADIAA